MSRIGPAIGYSEKRGPNGKRLCSWCEQKEVAVGRRKYCSEDCSEAYAITRNPSYARAKVWHRDKGRCARCGFDTKATIAKFRAHLERIPQANRMEAEYEIAKTLRELGFHRVACSGFHKSGHIFSIDDYWDMDHILPVVEGGGGCQLDNLRTLCCPCHKEVTAELRARHAKRGPKARQQKLFDELRNGNLAVVDQLERMLNGDQKTGA